jgi:hypothetical protein
MSHFHTQILLKSGLRVRLVGMTVSGRVKISTAVTAPKDLDEASAAEFFHKVEEHIDFNALRGYGNAKWGSDVKVSLFCNSFLRIV